jgi:hypothetical protein
VRLRSVRFEAFDVLVCRLETLAQSASGDTKLGEPIPVAKSVSEAPCLLECAARLELGGTGDRNTFPEELTGGVG